MGIDQASDIAARHALLSVWRSELRAMQAAVLLTSTPTPSKTRADPSARPWPLTLLFQDELVA